MNILLGITGSVSASLTPKSVKALQKMGDVQVVATNSATQFIPSEVYQFEGGPLYDVVLHGDLESPFDKPWEHGDPIRHTELKNWADIMVIAPCTANTLAKIVSGLADNLLTNVVRAWPQHKPMFIAPAMNVDMWEHPLTKRHLEVFKEITAFGTRNPIIPPQEKVLACGDKGMGALANIEDIIAHIQGSLRWASPLTTMRIYESLMGWDGFIPESSHPGSFGKARKFDTHTGVDPYVPAGKDTTVQPVEPGVVVDIVNFTGPKITDREGKAMSWWNDTKAVLIKGVSGVVVYGEIEPNPAITIGMKVGYFISGGVGNVIPVLPSEKIRPDIPHHSNAMLHIEMYESEVAEKKFRWGTWELGKKRPAGLKDPTPYLKNRVNR